VLGRPPVVVPWGAAGTITRSGGAVMSSRDRGLLMQDRPTPHPDVVRGRLAPGVQRMLALRAALVAPVLVALLTFTNGLGGLALWLLGVGAGAAVLLRSAAAGHRDGVTVAGVIGFLLAVAVTLATFDRSFAPLVLGAVGGLAVGWAALPALAPPRRWRRPLPAPPGQPAPARSRAASRSRSSD